MKMLPEGKTVIRYKPTRRSRRTGGWRPVTWVRVVFDYSRLQYQARCRACGRLLMTINAEAVYQGLELPSRVYHECPKITPHCTQLIHKGGKP